MFFPKSTTHSLSNLAGASKVDNPNGRPLWIAEEDILWLEVAMDDIHLWRGEVEKCRAELLGKLACQVQRDSTEVGVPEKLVEVVREKLKDKAEVVTKHKVTLQADQRESGGGGGERERERERKRGRKNVNSKGLKICVQWGRWIIKFTFFDHQTFSLKIIL